MPLPRIDGLRRLLRTRGPALGVMGLALAATVLFAVQLNAWPRNHAYPMGDWLFFRIAALWAYCLFLNGAWISTGYLLLSRGLGITKLPTLETLVASTAVGVVTFVLAMFLGGALRQFNATFAIALPTAMLALGLRPLAGFARERWAEFTAGPDGPSPHARPLVAIATAFGVV